MAEGVGFEPTAQGFAPRTAFPVPHLRPLGHPSRGEKLAEGRGFEPPRDLLGPYPISSRPPSTGLGHPSAPASPSSARALASLTQWVSLPQRSPDRKRRARGTARSGVEGNAQVEERRVLLGAEHVPLAGAAARPVAADCELDRRRRIVLDERRDPL